MVGVTVYFADFSQLFSWSLVGKVNFLSDTLIMKDQ